MSKVTKINFDLDQEYAPKDVVLINPIQLQRTFGTGDDYIETHIYDLNSSLLKSDYNFTNYKSLVNSLPTPSSSLNELTVDPLIDVINNGYNYGTVDITYNIFRNSFGNIKDRFYIKNISTDRTELRITNNNITGDKLSDLFDTFSNNISSSSYYKDFYLNFGSNNILIGVNILLEGDNLLIKLYEPLTPELGIKDQLWIIDKLSDPITYRVDFEIEAPVFTDTSNHLKGPNYNIKISNSPNASIDYVSYAQLLSNNSTSSYQQLKSVLEEKSLEINVDYSDYEQFVNFSSAKERLLNFVYKLKLIEDYNADLSVLASSISTPQISSSKAIIENNVNTIIEKFDGYEYYLYYESGSKAWPKKSNVVPYTNYEITSSTAITWLGTDDYNNISYYGGQLYTASVFDNDNQNNLINAIPEYLRIDPANQKYETFIYMIGQHFDNIWLYSKNITELYNADNSFEKGISEDLVFEALKSLGIKLYTNTSTTDNVFSYLLGVTPSGSYLPTTGSELITNYVTASNTTTPGSSIDKEVYKRLYHNLPYLLKTKGTERGLRALISCYGIPDTILRINEFGGTDKDSGSVEQYFNRVGYALNTKTGSLTGLTPWSPTVINEINFPGSNIVPDTIEFRFKTTGIPPSSSLYTQSLWQVETGSMTRFGAQLTFTHASNSGSYTDYGDLRLVISGNQGYTYSQPIHLPFFNNGWWNVMIQRETGSIPGANITSSNRYWIYAANSIYSGHDGDDIGFIGSSSIFITGSSVSSSYHNSWNTADTTSFSAYFGGGSSNNTIASGSTRFHGFINELRYWSVVLPKEDFINHTLNPLSYEYLNETSSYKYLSFRAPMGNDLLVSSSNFLYSVHPAYNKTGSFMFGGGSNTSSYLEIRSPGLTLYGVGIYGSDVYYGYGSEIVYTDDEGYYYLNAGNLGYGKPTNNKIRIINTDLVSGSTLSPFTNISQKPEIPLTKDTNILEIAISPQDQINNDIIYQLGYFDIDNYIGDPREANLTEYGKLKELRAFYFQKYVAKYNIFDIVRLVKYYNNSLFKMIKDFVPARANISTGITIKPHFLERPKIKRVEPSVEVDNRSYTQSINIGEFEGGQGGLFNGQTSSFTIITPTILGPLGITKNNNLEFFNGEINGCKIIATTQSLQHNPYLYSRLDAGLFAHSDYNILMNNVSSSRLSINKFKIDFNRSQNVASNTDLIMSESAINLAEIQDSNYTLTRHINPRYNGSKTISALYNIYTEGDTSYGRTAAIDNQVRKIGLFTNVTESIFLPRRQEVRLKYLVDELGDLTELNLLNNNWFEVQNTFKANNDSTVALFDVNKFGDQRTTNGLKLIFNSGYDYQPMLYFSSSDAKLYFSSTEDSIAKLFRYTNTNGGFLTGSTSLAYPITPLNATGGIVYNLFDQPDTDYSEGNSYYTVGNTGTTTSASYTVPENNVYRFTSQFNLALAFTASGYSASFTNKVTRSGSVKSIIASETLAFTSSIEAAHSTSLALGDSFFGYNTNSPIPGDGWGIYAFSASVNIKLYSGSTYRGQINSGSVVYYFSASHATFTDCYPAVPNSGVVKKLMVATGSVAPGYTSGFNLPGVSWATCAGTGSTFKGIGPAAGYISGDHNGVTDLLGSVAGVNQLSTTLAFNTTSSYDTLLVGDIVNFEFAFNGASTNNFTASVDAGEQKNEIQISSGVFPSATTSSAPFLSGSVNGNTLIFNSAISSYINYNYEPSTGSNALYAKYGDTNYPISPEDYDYIVLYVYNSSAGSVQRFEYSIIDTYTLNGQYYVQLDDDLPSSLDKGVYDADDYNEFLLLKRLQDETMVLLNFNKRSGKTSYGFNIPDNLHPDVLKNIDIITQEVKTKLIEINGSE